MKKTTKGYQPIHVAIRTIAALLLVGILLQPLTAVAGPTLGTANIVSLSSRIESGHGLNDGDVIRNFFLMFGMSHTNDLASIPTGEVLTDSVLVAQSGAAYSWTSAIGHFAGHVYTSPTATWFSPNSSTMSVFVLGTFTPEGLMGMMSPVNMTETISYTYTGGTISMSATIGGPANVPEPSMTWVLPAFIAVYVAMRRRHYAGGDAI